MKNHCPMIRQNEEKDCGAACLSMVLQYHGKKLPMATVAEAIKVDQYGANIYGLLDGAKLFGLTGTAMEGSAEEFFTEVRGGSIPLPVIARIVNRFGFEHYVVVTGIKGDNVRYCDPGEGRTKLTCEDFAQCFLGQIVTFKKSEHFVRENRRKGSMMEFIRLITRQKGLVLAIGLLSLLVTGISMAGTFLFQYLIDGVLPEMGDGHAHGHDELCGIEIFAFLIGAVGLLYLVRFLVQILRGKLLTTMTKHINLPLMLGYYDHVMDLKMDFFGNHKTGDIISRFNDAGKVQEALSQVTLTLMIDVVMVVFCGFTLYRQSPELFGIIAVILVLYVVISALYIRPLDKRNRQLMLENAQLNSYLKESLDGIQTIKAFNAGSAVKARTRELFTNFQKYGIKTAMLTMSKDALIELMSSVGILSLLWIGAVNILNGEMTLGTLMAFYTLMGYFLDPIRNVMELQSTLQSAVVAAGRLRDILDRSREQDAATGEKAVFENGDIVMEQVDFRYGNRSLVLRDLNLNIRRGEHVALVGTSGCGKTTVAKLLMGFYQPEQGHIRIGGMDLKGADLENLRSHMAYVPQETFLFSDSVRKNLLLGNDRQISDAQVEGVLEACGCDFVSSLPLGLDSMLDENGANLSGGQRQRLAIARALLRDPDILILDEATSNLDTISERKLQESLRSLNKQMTVIMVAHRLSSIRGCDQIFVLGQGTLLEKGDHTQLLEENGTYADLYNQMN